MFRPIATTTLTALAVLAFSAPATAAPPDGYSTFKDDFATTTAPNQLVTVATLRVPTGAAYAVFAKAFLGVPTDGLGQTVQCELVAGQDFDRTIVTHDPATAFASVALNVVHRFSIPVTRLRARPVIQLRCGVLLSGGPLSMGFIKITAISLDSLSNVPAP
ncbi:MAG TPA: hypothetical protein VNT55_00670 [Baekduia sp.]|nr:hypothetical protein [Baekduia sp.]